MGILDDFIQAKVDDGTATVVNEGTPREHVAFPDVEIDNFIMATSAPLTDLDRMRRRLRTLTADDLPRFGQIAWLRYQERAAARGRGR